VSFGDHRGRERRETYHHGNLREALVGAARALIAERGPSGFSFVEVARSAGVSPAAPYRHFRDRNALIAEVAHRGFDLFTADLAQAWNGGRPDPWRALEACGRAYLAFARREPAYYAAMFETGFALEEDRALAAAGDRAFAVLSRASEALCERIPAPDRPPSRMVALHIWAMSHGIASLFVRPVDGAKRRLPMTPEDLLEAGVLIYLGALGARPDNGSGIHKPSA
jgi:AcrR family transcriptional regulator